MAETQDFSAQILVHAAAAICALLLGAYQLAVAKGTGSHRIFGYTWCALMMLVAASSFWIHQINNFRGFSVIHFLSIYVLAGVPAAVLAVRRGNISSHRKSMIGLYSGGLVVAGFFTLAPGRMLGHLVFGW